MPTCVICRFTPAALDDVVVRSGNSSQCICLGCYLRETQTYIRMPKGLIREISDVVNALPA